MIRPPPLFLYQKSNWTEYNNYTKKIMKKYILLMMSFFCLSLNFAQVGINTDKPALHTGLHVSERMDPTSATPDKYNGIIIPRYTETQRDVQLTPNMNTAQNSMLIYNITEDCYNYWNHAEQEWKSLCGALGKSQFTFDCAAIQVKGNYVKGRELTSSHYLTIPVTVTKAGEYTFYATTVNGYSFFISGTFLKPGSYTIQAAGQGIPVAAQTDDLAINANGVDVTCTPPVKVNVQTDIATYTLNCSSVSVHGTYLKGVALTSSNNITMNVNVSTPGSYIITTTMLNGVIFTTSGVFSSTGTSMVTLMGSGAPTVNENFEVTITSNTSAGNAVCNAQIPITLPAMTYAVIGADNVYSWHPSNIRAKAFNSSSFGPSGKVKMISFNNLWNTNNSGTAITNLNSAVKPDVVLYYSFGLAPTAGLATALNNYVNAGGVLIYGTADNDASGTNTILNGVFGEGNAQQQIAGNGSVDDNVYPINSLQNDPIINGPFGNTAGKYWGEDNSSTGTIIVTKLPANSVQVAAANNQFSKYTVDPSYSTVWYNDTKNFVYFGDSVGASETSTSELEYPSLYNNGVPLTKRYGQYPNNATQAQFVYNSILELNAVAWAIRKAATMGINPH